MRMYKADGTEVTPDASGNHTLVLSSTYYLVWSMPDERMASVHLSWDAAIVLTSVKLQDCNHLSISPVSAVVGKWVYEKPSDAYVAADGAGAAFTAATGILAVAGGAVGGAMFHLAEFASARGRLEIVVGATGGVVQASYNQKR